MKRYILHPGYVISKSDGEEHYINATELARLYGVRIGVNANIASAYMTHTENDVHLYPRYDGDYSLT